MTAALTPTVSAFGVSVEVEATPTRTGGPLAMARR